MQERKKEKKKEHLIQGALMFGLFSGKAPCFKDLMNLLAACQAQAAPPDGQLPPEQETLEDHHRLSECEWLF